MKKLCNFRPIFLFSLSLIMGGYFFAISKFRDWVGIFTIVLVAVVVLFFVIATIKLKKIQILKFCAICFLIPFLIGGTLTSIEVNNKLRTGTIDGVYTVSGKVSQGGTKDNVYYFVIDDVTLESESKTTKLSGEVFVYSKAINPQKIYTGDRITFIGDYDYTYKQECQKDPLQIYNFVGGAYIDEVVEVKTGKGLKYNVLKWSKNQLNAVMDSNEAEISYAMLFGDKLLMDKDLKDNYKTAGISHILAVSGLHVGFLITLIGLLFSKIIKNKWVYFSLLFSILLGYAYICGWTASVMRAVTMCGIVFLSKSLFSQYDALNSLAIAGIINILIDPLNIFNVGFLLSFGVSFSIFALGSPLGVYFKKYMPSKMASSLSLSISAWLGSIPIIMFYFGNISVYSVFINFLVLPIIGVLFNVLVVTLILSGIWTKFLYLPKLMIEGLNLIVEGIASLKFAFLHATNSYFIMLIGFMTIAIMSQYNFLRHKKLYACVSLVGFIGLTVMYTIFSGGTL